MCQDIGKVWSADVGACRNVDRLSCRWCWRVGPRPKRPGSMGCLRVGSPSLWPAGVLRATRLSKPGRGVPVAHHPRSLDETVELVVNLRSELSSQGLDAGPHTISWHLQQHHQITVSPSTIRRRLAERGIGRAHKHTPVTLLIADLDIRVVATQTGELLRHSPLTQPATTNPKTNPEKPRPAQVHTLHMS